MFTLDQIDEIHTRLGNANTLAEYVRSLNTLGIKTYESYVMDGHSEYFGEHGYKVISPAAHETLLIAETSHRDNFLAHLRRHEEGQTSYIEMSQGLAKSGIEKWTVDTDNMTMTFYDKTGHAMLVESIS